VDDRPGRSRGLELEQVRAFPDHLTKKPIQTDLLVPAAAGIGICTRLTLSIGCCKPA